MRRAAIVVASVLALLGVTAVPASASVVSGTSSNSGSVVLYASSPGTAGVPVSSDTIPVTIHGDLSVTFHGDAATGCAARGLCGYRGTIVWTPGIANSIDILTYRVGRRLHRSIQLLGFGEGPLGGSGGATAANVTLTGPGGSVLDRCVDAVTSIPAVTLPVSAGRVRFAFAAAEPDLLRTRCAGPFASDVLGHLPVPSLTLRGLLAGHAKVSLAATQQFASDGLAGTVDGRLALAIGRPQRPQAIRTSTGGRYRQLLVGYRATLAGTLTETVAGDANPLFCAPLGSCGLGGTVTVTPGARADLPATLLVTARATTPWRNLLAAAGVIPHGALRGVTASLALAWTTPGTITADLTQSGTTCTDSSRIPGGFVDLAAIRGQLLAAYTPLDPANGLVSRCPGPIDSLNRFIGTTIPVSALSPGTARIALTKKSTAIVDDGYTGRLTGTLTLTLTRLGIRRRTVVGLQNAFTGSFTG